MIFSAAGDLPPQSVAMVAICAIFLLGRPAPLLAERILSFDQFLPFRPIHRDAALEWGLNEFTHRATVELNLY